jgi:hypothetical protein
MQRCYKSKSRKSRFWLRLVQSQNPWVPLGMAFSGQVVFWLSRCPTFCGKLSNESLSSKCRTRDRRYSTSGLLVFEWLLAGLLLPRFKTQSYHSCLPLDIPSYASANSPDWKFSHTKGKALTPSYSYQMQHHCNSRSQPFRSSPHSLPNRSL